MYSRKLKKCMLISPEYGPAPCSQSEVYDFIGDCRQVECGGVVYALYGVLQTPHWPESSNDEILCQWSIVLPNPEMRVSIEVQEMDISPGRSGTCFWNYLIMFDSSAITGAVPPLLTPKMCGTRPPAGQVVATGHVVHVWYQSVNPPNRGFSLSFSAA